MGVLPNAHGVAVHDFWKSYQKYDNVDHAMCCAHLERELAYAYETGKQAWAKPLQELLQTLCHRRKVILSQGGEAFPESELTGYLQRYDALVEKDHAANPIPERIPGKRGRISIIITRCYYTKKVLPNGRLFDRLSAGRECPTVFRIIPLTK